MALSLLDLPFEIRTEIYGLVFGIAKAIIEVQRGDDNSCILPQDGRLQTPVSRSSQLLRVNKTVLSEARPILYNNTTFHVLTHAFAGKLPFTISDGHPSSPHIKNWIWQLDCDMLKHHYEADLQLDTIQVARWNSLELRCRAECWRNSFLGEWCDREAFVAGREQLINYARVFSAAMCSQDSTMITLVEDRSQLGRGRVILRLARARSTLKLEVSQSDHLVFTDTC